MRGSYVVSFDQETGEVLERIPNQLTVEGEETFLKMITRGDATDVAVGGNFYLGLTGLNVANSYLMTDIVAAEPTVTNNYARIAVLRNSTGFPTIGAVNGIWRAQSATVNFTATPGNYSIAISRLFLCNVASGTAGKLFSVSAPLLTPKLITPTAGYSVAFELWMR